MSSGGAVSAGGNFSAWAEANAVRECEMHTRVVIVVAHGAGGGATDGWMDGWMGWPI